MILFVYNIIFIANILLGKKVIGIPSSSYIIGCCSYSVLLTGLSKPKSHGDKR